eukprot:TRINITY_DN12685_c3_g1_i1.p1 TRINITY_DN12685_c3_g1~~TRINITY_DN12685_c3_g1_i1.p1  ORF type:complete len:281 (+),score=36.63 TRINITY_DN12685_c3_g1_i1:42-884(+)
MAYIADAFSALPSSSFVEEFGVYPNMDLTSVQSELDSPTSNDTNYGLPCFLPPICHDQHHFATSMLDDEALLGLEAAQPLRYESACAQLPEATPETSPSSALSEKSMQGALWTGTFWPSSEFGATCQTAFDTDGSDNNSVMNVKCEALDSDVASTVSNDSSNTLGSTTSADSSTDRPVAKRPKRSKRHSRHYSVRSRPRASELPPHKLARQRELARQASKRRRERVIEQKRNEAAKIAQTEAKMKDLQNQKAQVEQELRILRDVVLTRLRAQPLRQCADE